MERRRARETARASRPSIDCSPAFGRGTTCPRCGGLMVADFCIDLQNGSTELEVAASRCVHCGEVVDPVILKNRRTQRPSPRPTSSHGLSPIHNESLEQGRAS